MEERYKYEFLKFICEKLKLDVIEKEIEKSGISYIDDDISGLYPDLSKYFSFNIANYISIVISLITVIFFLYSDIYENNYSIILVIGVLMKNIYKFYKDISYIYNRFILERYLFKFNYKKKVIIKNKDKMYKNRVHIFNDNGKLMNEKEYISTFFEKKP